MVMQDPIQLLGVLLLITVVPILGMGCTSYLKIHIVLSLIKNALGTQAIPNGLIVGLLSFILTCFVMEPVAIDISKNLSSGPIEFEGVIKNPEERAKVVAIFAPYYDFLNQHASNQSKVFFLRLRSVKDWVDVAHPTWQVVLPAFILTELKDAFRMGILLLLPFLAVDLIICNVLAGLGMHMVNPLTIGLPVKLLLFFTSDSWSLVIKALITSYRG